MEIPSWFGVDEYYWLLRTVGLGLIVYLLGGLFRTAPMVKSTVSKIKLWYLRKKSDNELDKPYKPLFKE